MRAHCRCDRSMSAMAQSFDSIAKIIEKKKVSRNQQVNFHATSYTMEYYALGNGQITPFGYLDDAIR